MKKNLRKIISLAVATMLLVSVLTVTQVFAAAGDLVKVNDMLASDKLFTGLPEGITATKATVDGINSARIAKATGEQGGWFSCFMSLNGPDVVDDKVDLTGTTYAYFHIKAPAFDSGLEFAFGLDGFEGATTYWFGNQNGNNFNVMADDSIAEGWTQGKANGNNIVVDKSWSGWIKMPLSNMKSGETKLTEKLNTIFRGNFWFSNCGTTASNKDILFGAVYAANDDSKVPVLADLIADEAVEIRDFDRDYTAVGQNLVNTENGNCFWGLLNGGTMAVRTSDKHVAHGKYSCEFYNSDSEDKINYTQFCAVGTYANLNSMKNKKYIAFHISVPKEVQYKNPMIKDEFENPVFSVLPAFTSTVNGQTIYWKNGGGEYENNAILFKDGGSEWVDAVTLDGHILLPFGYSGWIMLDTENFIRADNNEKDNGFKFEDLTASSNMWQMYFSQLGNKTGSVYLDSMYALDEDDELPGLVVTEGGNNDVGYFTKFMGDDSSSTSSSSTTSSSTQTSSKSTSDTDSTNTPKTSDNGIYMLVLSAVMCSGIVLVIFKKRCINN